MPSIELLHAEELERHVDAFCTCTPDPCPICGVSRASETCTVHSGRYLAEHLEHEASTELAQLKAELETAQEQVETLGEKLTAPITVDRLSDLNTRDILAWVAKEDPEEFALWLADYLEKAFKAKAK